MYKILSGWGENHSKALSPVCSAMALNICLGLHHIIQFGGILAVTLAVNQHQGMPLMVLYHVRDTAETLGNRWRGRSLIKSQYFNIFQSRNCTPIQHLLYIGAVMTYLFSFLLPPKSVLLGHLDVTDWDVVDPTIVEHYQCVGLLDVLTRALPHQEGPILTHKIPRLHKLL